jgi:hypothetical protein
MHERYRLPSMENQIMSEHNSLVAGPPCTPAAGIRGTLTGRTGRYESKPAPPREILVAARSKPDTAT